MGAGHGHGHGHAASATEVRVNRFAASLMIFVLVAVAVATLAGLVRLWPHHKPEVRSSSQFNAPGVTYQKATVVSLTKACKTAAGNQSASATGCGEMKVHVDTGPDKGTMVSVEVSPDVSRSGLGRGDRVELTRTPKSVDSPARYSFFAVQRGHALLFLFLVFVLLVAAVARLRGILAVVGLAFGAGVLVKFVLPALLIGHSGIAVALVGATLIMFVVLFLAHGVSVRTATALAGTLGGIAVTALVGELAVHLNHLSGVADETGALLQGFVGDLDFQGLFTCAVIIAGLGVLNDVTITQASAVWELRAAAPDMPARRLFASAMRIGRDHIASTIYTIVFAYAGGALAVLLLLYFYDRPILSLMSTEDIAEEIVRTLASAIGLVLAVPITTLIGTVMVGTRDPRSLR